MVPLPRLWGLLCLLSLPTMAGGFVDGLWPVIALLDLTALVLTAIDALLARRARLQVSRVLPPRLQIGIANRIEVQIINSSSTAQYVEIKDDSPDEFVAEPEQLRLSLAPKTRAHPSYRATPGTRGRFEFGDLHLRVHGPLGLVAHQRVTPAAVSVSVSPDMRGASRLLLSDAALDFVNLGLRQLRRDGRGSEFARLRDYTQGDSVRDVDWKATARRGRPVARVMESERSQTVLIGVDAGRSMAARVDGLTRLDHAVNAALFLAFVAVRNGDRVGLVIFADGIKSYLAPAPGRLQYRKLVDTLYSAKPSLTYVDYLALFKELNARLLRRSLLCVFTDFIDEDQALTLIDPMRRLAKRHVPVCLTVKDTALIKLLSTPPPDTETAWQQSVASELLLEREGFKRKVGQSGATVIDVEANKLSLAAVNKYLEIKSRGTL